MITCEGVTREYGPGKGIVDFSATIRPGEITVLLGRNGAGKTTLLDLIAGMSLPDRGRVLYDGQDLRVGDNLWACKRSLSWLPAEPYLYESLTVRENLEYVAKLRLNDRRAWVTLTEAIDSLECGGFLDSPVETLSFGMKKKAHILAALLGENRYFVWDEPHNGIDAFSNREINRLLRAARASGATVLISTHVLELADKLADRVLVLDRARLSGDYTAEEARAAGLF
jgi:ABC-2 type transport system ATP-binding protein